METPPVGKYSICCVAAVFRSIVWLPKMNPRIGVISWNCAAAWTVTVLLASSGHPLLLQRISMSDLATSTIEPFDSSWTRAHDQVRGRVTRLAVVIGARGFRGLEGALARGVQQRDVRVVDPAEVEDRRQEDEEQRQDECELDQARAPGPGPSPAASEEVEQVHLGHRCGFGVTASRMLGAVTRCSPELVRGCIARGGKPALLDGQPRSETPRLPARRIDFDGRGVTT